MAPASDEESQRGGQPAPEKDPASPLDWSSPKKAVNLAIVSILAFITPLESSIIVPGVSLLQDDFHETRKPVTSLVVSIFVLGFAFGPLLLSPLSELYGRRLLYNVSNVVTLGFTIASAAAPNISSFLVFRFMAGSFGAGPMNIGGGTIADQIQPSKRGLAMSIFFTGIFLGPVLGPVIGGFVAKYVGWRWVFWLVSIVRGVMTIATFLLVSESHLPTIQQRRGPSGAPPDTRLATKAVLAVSLTRPMRMLTRSPIIAGLSLYLALVYGYVYLLFTTFATVFSEQYNFGTDILGLAVLGLGVGCIIALVVLSWLSDWLQARLTRKHGESKPEYRLVPIVLGIPLLPIGLVMYGWTAEYRIHWIVPIIATSLTGAGLIFSYLPTQIYMLDAFTTYAASALSATSVVRSIVGGCLPIAGFPLYSALGYGWGNSLLAFISVLVSAAPLLFWRYGETLRKKYDVKFD